MPSGRWPKSASGSAAATPPGAAETGLQTADTVGTVAGIAAGGGAVYTAAKTGGKWAVAKVVAGTVAAVVADYYAEKGLRAAGVSETTIRERKLAAAVVSFILLHKAAKRGGTPAAADGKQPQVGGSSSELPGGTPPSSAPPPGTPPSTAGPEVPSGRIQSEPYGGKGGGHHLGAKRAFEGVPGYDANRALAIPNNELNRLNIKHSVVTTAQRKLYIAHAKTDKKLTWDTIQDIETKALVAAGADFEHAAAAVRKAIQAIKDAGVPGPVRIPWGR